MTDEKEPFWLSRARQYIGVTEIHGPKHNSRILNWWLKIQQKIYDDETSWCAAFVGGVLEECGIKSTRSAAARSYEKFGMFLDGPAVGAIVVFWRGNPKGWQGHVGYVVGRDSKNNLMVLGGNQGDRVSIAAFDTARVLSYHWPTELPMPSEIGMNKLPLLKSDGKLSTNEQ